MIRTILLGLALALCFAQPLSASPFISEIVLPTADPTRGPALEIGGIEGSGATVLILNASTDGGLIIRRKFELSGPGTVLMAEAATLDALVPPLLRPYTEELPPFSLPLGDPVALAVFDGTTALQPGADLAQPHLAGPELATNPIIDWVTLAPLAGPGLFTLDADLAAALGIDGLPRPIAPTGDVSVLARAIVEGLPQLDTLLPGTLDAGISGEPANLNDFPASPAVANPGTLPRLPDDDNPLPEPGTAGLALLLGVLTATRGPRSRCLPHDRGL